MIQFETPENIQVAYQPAGLGTRFVAWFVDNILMYVLGFVLLVVLLCTGAITDSVIRDVVAPGGERVQRSPGEPPEVSLYLIGVFFLVSGLGSFLYYGLSELFSRGQTIGKRMSGIRVVRLDGFALDPGGILVRNIFRLVDQIPVLWIVPFLSKNSQRLGDMAAGTVVVADRPESIGNLRLSLAERPAAEARFTFDGPTLKRARPQDFAAIEQILERWEELDGEQQQVFLGKMIPPLVARLQTEPPPFEERLTFLQDLLAAEYRRQHRSLG